MVCQSGLSSWPCLVAAFSLQAWRYLVVAARWLWSQLSRLNPFLDSPWEELGQGQYETRLLERSMYKICALLAVGFGDAGGQVIAENMKLDGDLNPMLPGKKTVRGGGGRVGGGGRRDWGVCPGSYPVRAVPRVALCWTTAC